MDMRIAKDKLREQAKQQRLAMSDSDVSSASLGIVEQLKQNINWGIFDIVHIYLPIESKHEIDTWPLINWIWENQPAIDVLVPVMDGEDMYSCQIMPETKYEKDGRGIPMPINPQPTKLQPEIIIAPCLMADRSGYRLGNGGGHYDRFLEKVDAVSVALCYKANLLDHLPIEPHDKAVNAVATQNELLSLSGFNVGL